MLGEDGLAREMEQRRNSARVLGVLANKLGRNMGKNIREITR